MSDFKDFINDNNFSEHEKENLKQDAQNLVNKYANMSQNELKYNLMQEVQRQKQNGTFDKQKLIYMLNSIKTILPDNVYSQILQALNSL